LTAKSNRYSNKVAVMATFLD